MTSINADGANQEVWIREVAGAKSYSVDSGGNWSALSENQPITITNTGSDYLKVLFKTNITITNGGLYFTCNSDYIQFGSTSLNSDGSRPIITISNVSNYDGLIDNPGNNSIHVANLQMVGAGTVSLNNGGGWFGQAFFGASATNNMFVNCSTDENMPISSVSGGIVGTTAANGAGSRLEIIGCTTAGSINGSAGGIIGQYAGADSGYIRISQCSTTGNIAAEGGGIFGKYAGRINGQAIATNCYSSGIIANTGGGGGIFGSLAGADGGTATANQCYSTGAVGALCGGIFGQNARNAIATYCYTTGIIFGGGIFGSSYSGSLATNCYTSGQSFATPTSGIYAGSGTDGSTNYSEANRGNSGAWASINAGQAGISPGSVWTEIATNTPYLLSSYGSTPYQLNNIIFDASGGIFFTNFDGSVVQGSTTAAAVLPVGYTYELLDAPNANFTINSATGAISVAASTSAGTYTLTIYSYINPYSITTYTLTVSEASAGPGASTSGCCGSLEGQNNLDYATIFQVKGGNALIADSTNPRNKFTSYQDMFRLKAALAFHR